MNSILNSLIGIPRLQKRIISIAVDMAVLVMATVLAVWIRLGEMIWPLENFQTAVWVLPLIAIPLFYIGGLYRTVIRYIGAPFVYRVFLAVSAVFVVWTAALFMLQLAYPRSAIIVSWLLVLLFIIGSRVLARRLFYYALQKQAPTKTRKNVLIYGAGSAGNQLFDAILKIPNLDVVGFIDDDRNLQKHEIYSARVYSRERLPKLIDRYRITEIYLAIPSLSVDQRNEIMQWLDQFPLKILTLPSLDEILTGQVSVSDVREVSVEDLLERDSVKAKKELLAQCIVGKSVLVTGAGGSIGSELCRQIVRLNPSQIVLFEISEYALYQIEKELRQIMPDNQVPIISILGSVLDSAKLERVIRHYQVETIYHAAAYKHVPMVEHNIDAGLRTNAFGTHQTARIAGELGVANFVLLSTDKAVRPTNVMGASKRLAEMALQALQQDYSDTRFVMVRFGNVLGSSGSVVPLFREQIVAGGPVTVTHPEVTRFFMTIPEAVSLVIQAGSMGVGGDVFLLDMGEPVKIDMLARKLIRLSGYDVKDASGKGDIGIRYTGLRPGEKLYEELLIGGNPKPTNHPRIMKAHEMFLAYSELADKLSELDKVLSEYDLEEALAILQELIPEYEKQKSVDYLR